MFDILTNDKNGIQKNHFMWEMFGRQGDWSDVDRNLLKNIGIKYYSR